MGAHDGLEDSPLIPTDMQFVVSHVVDVVVISTCKEPAEVCPPVRYAAKAIVQPGRNLPPHVVPGGSDVAAP